MSFDPNRPADPNRPVPAQPFTPAPPETFDVPPTPVVASPVAAQPVALPVRRKTSTAGRLLNLVLGLAAAVAIGGVAFAVGRTTAPVAAATTNRGAGNGAFPGGSFAPGASGQPGLGRGGFGGGGFTVNGTVVSVTGDTLTLKTANGQTVVVSIGASTTYHTETAATAADVQAGKTVQVQLAGGNGGGNGGGGTGRPNASGTTTGPVGTAGSVTVVP